MDWLQHAIDLAAHSKGGPFGACLVKDGTVIDGQNEVIATHDPTAHAEIVAIRSACKVLGTHNLSGWTLYSSCMPCPMCLGAIQWARVERVIYAANRYDACMAGFDDDKFWSQYVRQDFGLIEGSTENIDAAREVMKNWRGQCY